MATSIHATFLLLLACQHLPSHLCFLLCFDSALCCSAVRSCYFQRRLERTGPADLHQTLQEWPFVVWGRVSQRLRACSLLQPNCGPDLHPDLGAMASLVAPNGCHTLASSHPCLGSKPHPGWSEATSYSPPGHLLSSWRSSV